MAKHGTAKFAEGAEGTAGFAVFANFAVFFTGRHFCVLLFVRLGNALAASEKSHGGNLGDGASGRLFLAHHLPQASVKNASNEKYGAQPALCCVVSSIIPIFQA